MRRASARWASPSEAWRRRAATRRRRRQTRSPAALRPKRSSPRARGCVCVPRSEGLPAWTPSSLRARCVPTTGVRLSCASTRRGTASSSERPRPSGGPSMHTASRPTTAPRPGRTRSRPHCTGARPPVKTRTTTYSTATRRGRSIAPLCACSRIPTRTSESRRQLASGSCSRPTTHPTRATARGTSASCTRARSACASRTTSSHRAPARTPWLVRSRS
mmetsp:Transcript_3201/g.7907  ORF Transcript_3201/g.7907 Transcript_3201/m.7907 type:complete len:218 (+) Transcript_3201:426-1079(+)